MVRPPDNPVQGQDAQRDARRGLQWDELPIAWEPSGTLLNGENWTDRKGQWVQKGAIWRE